MRLINSMHNEQDMVWACYDNHEEWLLAKEQHKLELCDKQNPVKGHYIKTDNGWYVPVISCVSYDSLVNNEMLIKVNIPRRQYTFFISKAGKLRRNEFMFYPDEPIKYKLPKVRYAIIAKLMEQGMPIFEAVQYTYPKYRDRECMRVINALLNQEAILRLIKDQAMNKIKDEMLEQGIDAQWYVKQLKDLIADPKANPALKKYALEQIGKAIEQEEKRLQNTTIGLIQAQQVQGALQPTKPKLLEKKEA